MLGLVVALGLLVGTPAAQAGHGGNGAGWFAGGLLAGFVLRDLATPPVQTVYVTPAPVVYTQPVQAPVVYSQPSAAVVTAPAPPPPATVVYQQPPPVTVVYTAPPPPPVVFAPAPVYYPAPVGCYGYGRPVYVQPYRHYGYGSHYSYPHRYGHWR